MKLVTLLIKKINQKETTKKTLINAEIHKFKNKKKVLFKLI